MSILLLPVCDHPYHDRFLFGVIASEISACDNLLFWDASASLFLL